MGRVRFKTDAHSIDVKNSSTEKFDNIIEQIKEQGGNISAFIIESVIFRENSLRMNPLDSSVHLSVQKENINFIYSPFGAGTPNIPNTQAEQLAELALTKQIEETVPEPNYSDKTVEETFIMNSLAIDDDDLD